MKLRSSQTGEWPAGTHWTTGEVREVTVSKDTEIPAWLKEAKSKAKKTAKPATTDEG